MTYLLNESLPLYFMLLPLGIAALLAANLYRVQNVFSKTKSNYQAQLREAQNRLDAAQDSEKSLRNTASQNLSQLKDVTARLHKAESDAVEREALIVQLNKLVENLKHLSDVRVQSYKNEIEELKSKLQLSELAHIETQTDLDGERYYLDAVAKAYRVFYMLVRNNSRPRKQYSAILDKMGELERKEFMKLNKDILDMTKEKPTETPQSETVVHDILGVARTIGNQEAGIVHDSVKFVTVYKADQSESDNGRHNIVALCNEVNRGIAEQAERIRQELEAVDMSQLRIWDSVKLRCGAIKVVKSFTICNIDHELDTHTIKVHFADNPFNHYYDKAGNYEVNREDPMDIIQIIKATK